MNCREQCLHLWRSDQQVKKDYDDCSSLFVAQMFSTGCVHHGLHINGDFISRRRGFPQLYLGDMDQKHVPNIIFNLRSVYISTFYSKQITRTCHSLTTVNFDAGLVKKCLSPFMTIKVLYTLKWASLCLERSGIGDVFWLILAWVQFTQNVLNCNFHCLRNPHIFLLIKHSLQSVLVI